MIILHGLFGSSDNWASIAQNLGQHFHVFALDLRNHGRSPHAADMTYSLMSEDVIDFMQRSQIQAAALLGHSLGGKVAMQLALTCPDKVQKLIVADMAPRAYAPRHVEIITALMALDLSKYNNRSDLENALAPAIPELPLRRFLLKNVNRDPSGAFHWRMNLSGIQANYDHLIEALPADKTFDQPTLFIRGEKSDYILESDLPLIRRLFPKAEIHTLPNAGHWLHADSPMEFVKVVSEFLQRS